MLACAGEGARRPDAAVESAGADARPLDGGATCGLVRSSANPDPIELVQLFVERAVRGDFLQRDAWLDTAYACPGHLPATDLFLVIAAYRVRPLLADTGMARVLVTYEQIGAAHSTDSGFVLARGLGVGRDTFTVVHTAYGWRLASPQLPQRVLAHHALRRVWFREGDRRFLEGVVARRPPASAPGRP